MLRAQDIKIANLMAHNDSLASDLAKFRRVYGMESQKRIDLEKSLHRIIMSNMRRDAVTGGGSGRRGQQTQQQQQYSSSAPDVLGFTSTSSVSFLPQEPQQPRQQQQQHVSSDFVLTSTSSSSGGQKLKHSRDLQEQQQQQALHLPMMPATARLFRGTPPRSPAEGSSRSGGGGSASQRPHLRSSQLRQNMASRALPHPRQHSLPSGEAEATLAALKRLITAFSVEVSDSLRQTLHVTEHLASIHEKLQAPSAFPFSSSSLHSSNSGLQRHGSKDDASQHLSYSLGVMEPSEVLRLLGWSEDPTTIEKLLYVPEPEHSSFLAMIKGSSALHRLKTGDERGRGEEAAKGAATTTTTTAGGGGGGGQSRDMLLAGAAGEEVELFLQLWSTIMEFLSQNVNHFKVLISKQLCGAGSERSPQLRKEKK